LTWNEELSYHDTKEIKLVTYSDILKKLREQNRYSQSELAEKTGIDQSVISKYERGLRIPTTKHLDILSRFYNVSIDYLLGKSPEKKHGDSRNQPIIHGTIEDSRSDIEYFAALGEEAYPYEEPTIYLPVYEEVAAGSACFADERPIGRQLVDARKVQHDIMGFILVKVKGDSMILDGIAPGSLVLVHKQDRIENGKIAIIRIKGDGVTIKRFKDMGDGTVKLIPRNPAMSEEIYPADSITICGQVVQSITYFE
jgi:repressor LexA